jgi:hypothetical protein
MVSKHWAISPARVVDLLRAYRNMAGCAEALEPHLETDARLIGGIFRHRACAAVRKARSPAEQEYIVRLQVRAAELLVAQADRQRRVLHLIAYSTDLRLAQRQLATDSGQGCAKAGLC